MFALELPARPVDAAGKALQHQVSFDVEECGNARVHRDVGFVLPVYRLKRFEIGELHPFAVGHQHFLESLPLRVESRRLGLDGTPGKFDDVFFTDGFVLFGCLPERHGEESDRGDGDDGPLRPGRFDFRTKSESSESEEKQRRETPSATREG